MYLDTAILVDTRGWRGGWPGLLLSCLALFLMTLCRAFLAACCLKEQAAGRKKKRTGGATATLEKTGYPGLLGGLDHGGAPRGIGNEGAD